MNKFSRLRTRLMSLLLATTVSLSSTGCSCLASKNTGAIGHNQHLNQSNYSNEEVLEIFYRSNISDETMGQYISAFDSIVAEYYWDDYYLDDEKLANTMSIAESYKECTNVTEDFTRVVDLIIENSLKVIDSQWAFFTDLEKITDVDWSFKEREKIHRRSLANAIERCFTTSSNIAEDICCFNSVEIVFGELYGTFVAYYDNENKRIVISRSAYEACQTLEELEMFLTDTLQHELNHCRQFICQCRVDSGQQNESIATDAGLQLVIESSAEGQICNVLDNPNGMTTNDYTYCEERINEAFMLLMVVFKDDKVMNDYYQTIFDANLPALYDFFELETAQDYKTFYNIALSLDTLVGRGPLAEELIVDSQINRYESIKEQLGFGYKLDVFKIALKDLIYQLEKDESLSLIDSIVLYNLLKSYVVNYSCIFERDSENTGYYQKYQQSFVDGVLECETIFYEFIQDLYGVDADQIREIELFNLEDNLTAFERLRDKGIWTSDSDMTGIKLMKKFPILKTIIWNSPISYYSGRVFNYNIEKEENVIVPKLVME